MQTLTRLDFILILTIAFLVAERVFHFIKYGQPIKKMNAINVQYKEAVSRSMGNISTLKERDAHIERLEKQLEEERAKNIITTGVIETDKIVQIQ